MKTGRFFALARPTASLLGMALATASGPLLGADGFAGGYPAAPQTAREPLVGDDAKDESNGDLARQMQNPVGDLISFRCKTT